VTRERAICAAVAVLCHAALLFGFRLGSRPAPRPISDEPVEVSLVAAEPAPTPPASEIAVPPPSPPPPPEPIPELPPKPEPKLEPEPKPETPTPPPHREPPKPQRPPPPIPHKAAPPATATGAATEGAPVIAGTATGPRGNSTARPSFNPKPPYPSEARRLRQEGRVVLQVTVSAEGRATNVSILRSSGVASLDESAVATVRRWTFDPARLAGVAIPSKVEVPVTFTLSNQTP